MLSLGERTILTTKLLAESTGPSETISPAEAVAPAKEQPIPAAEAPLPAAEEPPTGGLQPGTSPLLFAGGKALEEPEGGLLEDQTMDGLEVPPEPTPGFEQRYRPSSQPVASPLRTMFPGKQAEVHSITSWSAMTRSMDS